MDRFDEQTCPFHLFVFSKVPDYAAGRGALSASQSNRAEQSHMLVLKMQKAQRAAEATLDTCAVFAFLPFRVCMSLPCAQKHRFAKQCGSR